MSVCLAKYTFRFFVGGTFEDEKGPITPHGSACEFAISFAIYHITIARSVSAERVYTEIK